MKSHIDIEVNTIVIKIVIIIDIENEVSPMFNIEYLKPLITGEDYPVYHSGLPNYKSFEKTLVKKQLDAITHL